MSAERALVARLLAELSDSAAGGALGAGDDAAVVAVEGTPVAITVDVVVEGVHWNPAVSSPGDVGWKAIAVNVSDLA
ncbi:MAG: thiamine-phosphate kinase, partial [Actinobacteria bacterium QS_5_72_10]